MKTKIKTQLQGVSENLITEVKRTRPFLFVFNIEWWEAVLTEHIGNDIHIKSDNQIRNIYLNGEKVN